jgi:phosphatidylinositol-bisphosphatase
VWVGDLNYRLDFPVETWGDGAVAKSPPKELFEHIKRYASEGKFKALMERDQLRAAIAANEAFLGFSESEPTFPPTFKVFRNHQVEYTSQRTPAYCDRILWRSSPYLLAASIDFWSGEKVGSSDHKPVAALLQVCKPYFTGKETY